MPEMAEEKETEDHLSPDVFSGEKNKPVLS